MIRKSLLILVTGLSIAIGVFWYEGYVRRGAARRVYGQQDGAVGTWVYSTIWNEKPKLLPRREDLLSYVRIPFSRDRRLGLASCDGRLGIAWIEPASPKLSPPTAVPTAPVPYRLGPVTFYSFARPSRVWDQLTCPLAREDMRQLQEWARTEDDQIACVTLPAWIPFVLTAAWPAAVLILVPIRRRRRRLHNLCRTCGYNLTGNVTGVCSECGSAVTMKEGPSKSRGKLRPGGTL